MSDKIKRLLPEFENQRVGEWESSRIIKNTFLGSVTRDGRLFFLGLAKLPFPHLSIPIVPYYSLQRIKDEVKNADRLIKIENLAEPLTILSDLVAYYNLDRIQSKPTNHGNIDVLGGILGLNFESVDEGLEASFTVGPSRDFTAQKINIDNPQNDLGIRNSKQGLVDLQTALDVGLNLLIYPSPKSDFIDIAERILEL
jgi:hypothetical protein